MMVRTNPLTIAMMLMVEKKTRILFNPLVAVQYPYLVQYKRMSGPMEAVKTRVVSGMQLKRMLNTTRRTRLGLSNAWWMQVLT